MKLMAIKKPKFFLTLIGHRFLTSIGLMFSIVIYYRLIIDYHATHKGRCQQGLLLGPVLGHAPSSKAGLIKKKLDEIM